ncbi:c-type cytochrome [Andreprevotia chitinilytica]|uniref:c-type cytochrome n=1 Tax=Andreprevotia chitinilytica TaxID=396808 RepID=UPI00069047B5|nr:c-type cytochrome [Andreprevotia chitinilytica]
MTRRTAQFKALSKIVLSCALVVPLSLAHAETPEQSGARVFLANCAACHKAPGVDGSPLLGDATAWKDRMAGGRDALYTSAIKGFTGYYVMPAKGGNAALSDAEVKAAVDYLLNNSGVH